MAASPSLDKTLSTACIFLSFRLQRLKCGFQAIFFAIEYRNTVMMMSLHSEGIGIDDDYLDFMDLVTRNTASVRSTALHWFQEDHEGERSHGRKMIMPPWK